MPKFLQFQSTIKKLRGEVFSDGILGRFDIYY